MNAFVIMIDAQLLHPNAHRGGIAAGDNRSLHSALLQHFQAVAIERVKRFDFFAVVADINMAVGEHTVHIHNQKLDALGARLHIRG